MRLWLQSNVLVAATLTSALLALVFVRDGGVIQPARPLPLMIAESHEYFQLAQGDFRHVESPFPKRALQPFLARVLAHVTGLPLRAAFLFLDFLALTLLVFWFAAILTQLGLSPWIAAFFVLTPFTLSLFELGYLPDLLQDALTALFFLLLLQKRLSSALLILALSFTGRESTLVLCVLVIALACFRRERILALGAGLVTFFGITFGAWIMRGAQPNIHHLPDFLYLALKVPHQFMKNVLGLRIWSNTYPYGDVIAKWTLPHPVGAVRQIGLCTPEWTLPLFTLLTLLTLFGSGPLLIIAARKAQLWSTRHPFAVQLAAVYGLLSFLLGPSLGDWIDRLIGYGWPLFWIGVPYLIRHAASSGLTPALPERTSLVSLLLISWLPPLLGYSRYTLVLSDLAALAFILVAYLLTWLAVRREFRSSTLSATVFEHSAAKSAKVDPL